MARVDVTIATPDGQCPLSLFTPATGAGPWPGVIFFMDGLGIRPSLWQMAQQLADHGYGVLLPDLYYREGRYAVMDPKTVFADPASRERLLAMIARLDRPRKIMDAKCFIDFLAARPEISGTRFGATGYCMGGNVALTVAGAFPDRFAAIASFHGGHLASDKPDSPHHFLEGVSARLYVAAAMDDATFPEAQRQRLEQALTGAGIAHRIETYEARHGFAVPDHPAYDEAAAQRHWQALFSLFDAALPRD